MKLNNVVQEKPHGQFREAFLWLLLVLDYLPIYTSIEKNFDFDYLGECHIYDHIV
ncbi:hypothetical protein GCM10027286_13210 [Virgibacillus ainsalahensis]